LLGYALHSAQQCTLLYTNLAEAIKNRSFMSSRFISFMYATNVLPGPKSEIYVAVDLTSLFSLDFWPTAQDPQASM
jgi:hypothetical protein